MTQSIAGSTTVQTSTDMDDPMAQEFTSQDLSSANSEEILLGKLLEASSYERAGEMRQAATLYHEIVAADANGTWGQSARKALETIEPQGSALNGEDVAGSNVVRDVPVGRDVVAPSKVEEVYGSVVTPTELGVHEQGKFQVNVPTRLGHSVSYSAPSSRLVSLQRMILGATVLPIAAVSIAAFWWLPQRFEQRWEETSPASQAEMISSSDIKLLVTRQRQVGLLVGLLTVSGSFLVMGSVLRTWMRHLSFLRQQADSRARGQAFDEQGLRLLGVSDDEIGKLTRAIHDLGDYSVQCEEKLADAEQSKRIDLESATRETKRLQQQVIELLVQIEEVRSGNLTARAPMIDGKVGSIADAFNATIDSLRDIVAQVVEVTQSLTQGARSGAASVRQVSDSALEQSQTLKRAREDVAAMVVSIEQVSELTQSSAQVARNAIKAAHDGDLAMDRTVVSMEKIRTAVSNTSKRAKRLAEAAQEVSQILAIVTGISEQANLLAFNASIEAARAGEQGQGFRQVSDEVRNLAAQVSESAQDIERLVQSIQEETASVINVLEVGTSEVVSGTQLVHQTQKTLSHLTTLSREIDTALQRVAANTTEQTQTSQQVNQTMKSVAGVSLANAEAAREVVEVLQQLLREVSTLQSSVDRFQV